jgi:hypothetical protein
MCKLAIIDWEAMTIEYLDITVGVPLDGTLLSRTLISEE